MEPQAQTKAGDAAEAGERSMSEKRMACLGAQTRSVRTTEHMEECRACGTRIQFQLVDHPFWGFKAGCDRWWNGKQALLYSRGPRRVKQPLK